MAKRLVIVILALVLMAAAAPQPVAAAAPAVATRGVVAKWVDIASLSGYLSSMGGNPNVTVSFEYGVTTAYGSASSSVVKNATGDFTIQLGSLARGTVYFYRAKAVSGGFTVYGAGNHFRTTDCFIATEVCGEDAPETLVLREYRDSVLLKSWLGSRFVDFYYVVSPHIADFLRDKSVLRAVTREILIKPVVWLIRTTSGGSE